MIRLSCLKCINPRFYVRSVTQTVNTIEGFATPQDTKAFCDLFCNERPTSLIKKQALTTSSLGYGTGNVRLYEDNWTGILQKIVGTGCNVIQMDIREKHIKDDTFSTPSGYEGLGNILNGIVYSNNIKRESLLFQGRIFTHDSKGQPYTTFQMQKQIDLLLSTYNITTLDNITLQMPGFITDSQLVVLLSIVQRAINNKQLRGFSIGTNYMNINDYYQYNNNRNNNNNNNNLNLYKLIRIASDLHILDSFIGIQIPFNILENHVLQDMCSINPDPEASSSLTDFNEFIYNESIHEHMNLFEICDSLDLTVGIDRAFETNGCQTLYNPKTNNYDTIYRPTKFIEVETEDTSKLNEDLQECINICNYMETVYKDEIINQNKQEIASLPVTVNFTKTVIESLTGLNNLCIYEDIYKNKLLPELRDLITDICNCEEAKKWAFAYRLSIQSLMNLYKKAYKGREYDYLKNLLIHMDSQSSKFNIYNHSLYKRVLELYLSSIQNPIIYTDNLYIHEKGIDKNRLFTNQEAKELIQTIKIPIDH